MHLTAGRHCHRTISCQVVQAELDIKHISCGLCPEGALELPLSPLVRVLSAPRPICDVRLKGFRIAASSPRTTNEPTISAIWR